MAYIIAKFVMFPLSCLQCSTLSHIHPRFLYINPSSNYNSIFYPLPIRLMNQFRGYMAAVPSKHDLASFVRTIHAELALSVPSGSAVSRQAVGGGVVSEAEAGGGGGSGGGSGTEADLSLAPLLLRGIVTAVKLLCTKVEAMHRAEVRVDELDAEWDGISGARGLVNVSRLLFVLGVDSKKSNELFVSLFLYPIRVLHSKTFM